MNRLFIIFLTVIYFNTGNINANPNTDFFNKIKEYLNNDKGDVIYICKITDRVTDKISYSHIGLIKGKDFEFKNLEETLPDIYINLTSPDENEIINKIKEEANTNSYWEYRTSKSKESEFEVLVKSYCADDPIIIAEKLKITISQSQFDNIENRIKNIYKIFLETDLKTEKGSFDISKVVSEYRGEYNVFYNKEPEDPGFEKIIEFYEKQKKDLEKVYGKISPLINLFYSLDVEFNKINRCYLAEDNNFNNVHCFFDDDVIEKIKKIDTKDKLFQYLLKNKKSEYNDLINAFIFNVLDGENENFEKKHNSKISNIDEQITLTQIKITDRDKKRKQKRDTKDAMDKKIKNIDDLLVKFNLNNFTSYSEIENKYLILKDKISFLINSDEDLDINLKETLNKISSLEDEVSEMKDNIKEEEVQNKLDNFRKDKTYKAYKDESQIKTRDEEFTTYINQLSKLSLSDEINDLNSLKKITDQSELINTIEEDKNVSDKEILKNLKELENRNTEIANLEDSLARSKRNLIILIILFIFSMSGLGYYIYRLRTLGEHKLKNSFNSQFKDLRNKYDSLIINYNSVNNELSTFKNSKVKNEKKEYKDRFQDNNENDVIEEKINPITELLQAYEKTLIDPNRIDLFKDIYDGIGLDRQSRIISQSDTILIKDSKDFALSNFWLVKVENDLILLPGRTLKVNVSSLVADNARYARDLLSGIFKYSLSNEFRLNQYGIIQLHGDHYIVKDPGRIDLPKT